jgi:RNA recognition motif-containing protein
LYPAHDYPPVAMSNLSDASRLKATVFVGGLDQAVTQQTLYHAFLPFGDIVEVNLPKPDLPGAKEEHRGFGYVEFETAADANDAIDNMDRSELYGQVIKVAAAKPQKDANEGLGSKTAVWEQVCIFTGLSCDIELTPCRRAGWPSMLLAKRIDKQLSKCKKSQMGLWTQCKV